MTNYRDSFRNNQDNKKSKKLLLPISEESYTNDAESAPNMSQLTSYLTIIEQQSAVLNVHKYFKYFISNLISS